MHLFNQARNLRSLGRKRRVRKEIHGNDGRGSEGRGEGWIHTIIMHHCWEGAKVTLFESLDQGGIIYCTNPLIFDDNFSKFRVKWCVLFVCIFSYLFLRLS